jgi:serine/threonine-protein kinase
MRALQRKPADRYPTAAAMRDDLESWLSCREPEPGQSLAHLMKRLFSREIREQRLQIQGLLQAQPEVSENGGTLVAPLLVGGTQSGSLRGTQVSSVTDLMQELTRQRQVTTRLLGGMLALVACSLAFGVYWTLVLRPGQTASVAASATVPVSAPTVTTSTLPARERLEPTPPSATSSDTAAAKATAATTALRRAATSAGAAVALPLKAGPLSATVTARAELESKPFGASVEPEAAPAAPPRAAEPGRLSLDTSPWSIVSVDGRVLGQTPIVGAAMPAGTHTLVLSNPEQGLKTTYQVTISAGRTTARRIGLD